MSAVAVRESKSSKSSGAAKGAAKGGSAKGGSPRKGKKLARWTEEQVKVLLEAVDASATAKAGFEVAARRLNKSVGTVQQKYYAVQKQETGGRRRGGAPTAAAAPRAQRQATSISSTFLAELTTDQLVRVAQQVKSEVERRRSELDKASKLFG